MVTARVRQRSCGTADDSGVTEADDSFPLLIAVAASQAERIRLAELIDDEAPLLLVSSLDELRRLLTPGQQPAPQLEPGSAPAPEVEVVIEPEDVPVAANVLTIDPARSVAQWRGREVTLTGLECELLTRLQTQPLRVWTYEELHQAVWRNRHLRGSGDVHSLVKRLRRKLGNLGATVTITAVRGTGLRLTDHQSPSVSAPVRPKNLA
jgi:DNA-binding winged helix-turn-helix (wHTH) protein